MTCPCNDTKRKMPGCDAGTPPVLEVHSKDCPVLFHTVTIPASIGDLESMPPQPGAYRNARVIYEADKATYLYDSDGIPQLLIPDTEAIIAEAVSQIPTATTTADGLMSGADKTALNNLSTTVTGMTTISYGSGTAETGVYGTVDYIKYGRFVFLLINNLSGNGATLDRTKTLFTGLPPAQEGQGGAAVLFTVTPAAISSSVNNPAVRLRINADGSLQAWYSYIQAFSTDYIINTSLVYLAQS